MPPVGPGCERADLDCDGEIVAGDPGDLAIWQSDMRKAKTAWRKGNYENARKHLMKALKKGGG